MAARTREPPRSFLRGKSSNQVQQVALEGSYLLPIHGCRILRPQVDRFAVRSERDHVQISVPLIGAKLRRWRAKSGPWLFRAQVPLREFSGWDGSRSR